MTNEAVIIELTGSPPGEPIQFSCANHIAISKGTFLKYLDNRTVSSGNLVTSPCGFAGIAAADKEANDGSQRVTGYTKGIFDCVLAGVCFAGEPLIMSGANTVARAETQAVLLAAFSGGRFVGKAQETGSDGETISVHVGDLY